MQRTRVVVVVASLLFVTQSGALRAAQGDRSSAARFERLIYAELMLGAGWPIGATNTEFDPSFIVGGRVEMQLKSNLRGGLELAFHSFDAELPATRDNQGVLALSLFGKLTGVWGPYRPFGLLGVGIVNSKRADATRRWDPALQIGGGAEAPVSEHVSIMVGSSLHTAPRGGEETELLWLTGYLGFVFKQP